MVLIIIMVELMRRYSRQLQHVTMAKKLRRIQTLPATQRPDQPKQRPSRRLADRFTSEQLAEVVTQYRAGVPTTALCRHYGLSKSSVLETLRVAGVQMRRQPLTTDQVARAVRLYESGLSQSQVSTRLGLPQSSVQLALTRAGVKMRPPTGGRASRQRQPRLG